MKLYYSPQHGIVTLLGKQYDKTTKKAKNVFATKTGETFFATGDEVLYEDYLLKNKAQWQSEHSVSELETLRTELESAKKGNVKSSLMFQLLLRMNALKGDKGYTPIKGQDYFTDEELKELVKQATPKKDTDYKDGYTPVKYVDYFTKEEQEQFRGKDGKDGRDGRDGLIGLRGDKGDSGDNGELNHKWDGTLLMIKNADGTWGAGVELKGKDGRSAAAHSNIGQVMVDNRDAPEYLEDKLVAGSGVTITSTGTDRNKTLTLSSIGGGGGETNTASNTGTDGVGVYDAKVAVDLQFRNIAPASNKVTTTLNSKDIDIDIVEANIDHDALSNFTATEHRVINDAGTSATELWSASKISTELASVDNSTDVTLSGTPDYITISGQVITRNLIVATTDLSATGTKDSTTFLRGDDTWAVPPTGGGGEVNTGSNQGSDGVGIYDTKSGVDLQFRHVAPGSTKVTTTLNGKDIDVDVVDANIDHDSLANFSADEHYTQANITTVGTVTTGNVDAVVSSASTTTQGKVELATQTETSTGTDTTRAVTPSGLANSVYGTKSYSIALLESDTSVATGDGKVAFTVPSNMNGLDISNVIVSVHTKGVTGTTDVQVRRRRAGADVDVLSTKVTVGDEFFAQDGVINTANDDLATGDQIYIDVDAVHSGTAPLGLGVTIESK